MDSSSEMWRAHISCEQENIGKPLSGSTVRAWNYQLTDKQGGYGWRLALAEAYDNGIR